MLSDEQAAPSGTVSDQLGRPVAMLPSLPAQAARGILSRFTNRLARLYLVHLRADNRQWQARWSQP